MFHIIQFEKSLTVTRTSSVIDIDQGIAVVNKKLSHRTITDAGLSTRPSVDSDYGWSFIPRLYIMGFVINSRNLQAIERLVPDDFSFDKIISIDFRVHRIRQLGVLTGLEVVHKKVIR